MTPNYRSGPRRSLGVAIALIATAIVLVGILGRSSYTWHRQYMHAMLAFAAIENARQTASPTTALHLLAMARSLLGVRSRQGSVAVQSAHLALAAISRLHQLSFDGWVVSPASWAVVFAVLMVAVYWFREAHIAWLEMEHGMLKEQLLAIERGWASLASNPNPHEVMHHILFEVTQHTAVRSAAIYQLTADRSASLALYASIGNFQLSNQPIPQAFIGPTTGLIGESLASNVPKYSGEEGEAGYLIPGVRKARVAIFPLRYQQATWGVLLLTSNEAGWYFTYRDLLEVLAQEFAIAAASAELAEQARTNQLMEERARMQSEILANVSHELRTPLGLVKGYLETLQQSWERLAHQDRQEFLDVAVSETEELEGLIDHLLLMSSMDHAGALFRPEPFLLSSWLDALIAHYPAWERDRVLVSHLPSQDMMVYGDPRELHTACRELLQNAVKYSKGRVELYVDVSQSDWTITVRDFGSGVPPSEITRIFERFYRVPAHAQSEVRGSGLGLSIVKRIVDNHHGHIRAENLPDLGFQVTMQLPLAPLES